MQVTFEPKDKYVSVTVENDEDAKKFCELAYEVVLGNNDDVKKLHDIYKGYGEQLARDNTVLWDKQLWDYVVERKKVSGGVYVEVTFAHKLLEKLELV